MSANIIEYHFNQPQSAEPAKDGSAFTKENITNLLQPVRIAMDAQHDKSEYDASLASFSRPLRLANAINCYVEEVTEGGHIQFFQGFNGIVWEDALTGLREIGSSKPALILSGAALRVGGTPPFDHGKRISLLRILKPKMGDLDRHFSQCDPLSDLWNYMVTNRASFEFTDEAFQTPQLDSNFA